MGFKEELKNAFVRLNSGLHPIVVGFINENPHKEYRAIYTGSDVNVSLEGKVVVPSHPTKPYTVDIPGPNGEIICSVPTAETDFNIIYLDDDSDYRKRRNLVHNRYVGKFTVSISVSNNYHILPPIEGILSLRVPGFDPTDPYQEVTAYLLDQNEDIVVISVADGQWRSVEYDPSVHPQALRIRFRLGSGGTVYSYELDFKPKMIS